MPMRSCCREDAITGWRDRVACLDLCVPSINNVMTWLPATDLVPHTARHTEQPVLEEPISTWFWPFVTKIGRKRLRGKKFSSEGLFSLANILLALSFGVAPSALKPRVWEEGVFRAWGKIVTSPRGGHLPQAFFFSKDDVGVVCAQRPANASVLGRSNGGVRKGGVFSQE